MQKGSVLIVPIMPKPQDTFLVAKYLKTPKDPKKTSRKGYINDYHNISYVENVTITRGLKNRDITASIILNLTQKTVYKCRFTDKNDWESLASYYAKGYPEYLKLIDPPKIEETSESGTKKVVAEGDKLVVKDPEEEEDKDEKSE